MHALAVIDTGPGWPFTVAVVAAWLAWCAIRHLRDEIRARNARNYWVARQHGTRNRQEGTR